MSNFREERSATRKRDIVRTAIRIFKEKGYDETTIEEIANELKYTKSSIYYYIPKKEYLLFLCHENYTNMILNKARPIANSDLPPDEKLRELIRTHVEVLIDEMSMLTMVLQHEYDLDDEHKQKIYELRNEYEGFIKDALKDGVEKGIFCNTNLSMARLAIIGSLNWIPHWYKKSGTLSKKDITEFFAEYLIAPLLL